MAPKRMAFTPSTQLYRFDISGAGKPRFTASGEVPGWLLNQYSLSAWDGNLRVATTDATASTVYVLKPDGARLVEAGHVGGLGKGERIYAVRFLGTTGFVVTFKQTDPLYTLDLRDPAKPVLAGELKLPGFSAYLHPGGDGRLIGLGRAVNDQGLVQNSLQLSLFDVGNLGAPKRLAQYVLTQTSSEAEYNPHAFFFWPASGLLVIPFWHDQRTGVVVLKVSDTAVTEVGKFDHPGQYTGIRRTLIIGGTLWTMSGEGLQANDAATLAKQAWVPWR